ncbi:MAG: aminotransferase class III-fold pyridoxal phosphate-dependent enzyme, partial [Gemmatimonadetes bacterium]|nr:aminotransferase class III-fold pyridoxal phosphate-dependent enzyme [Gemmatimonadota bacterium]
ELMWGIELDRPAAPVVAAARERGLLVCSAGASVVRLLPALNIPMEELDQGLAILGGILTGAVE